MRESESSVGRNSNHSGGDGGDGSAWADGFHRGMLRTLEAQVSDGKIRIFQNESSFVLNLLEMDFLEFKVHALRDHLTETSTRLHQTLQENERLRVMNSTKTSPVEHEIQHSDVSSRSRENPKQNPHLKISQLRKCLTAAEADLAKQQEAMDVLKHRLEDYGSNRSTTSATVSPNLQRNELDRFPAWEKLLVLKELFCFDNYQI